MAALTWPPSESEEAGVSGCDGPPRLRAAPCAVAPGRRAPPPRDSSLRSCAEPRMQKDVLPEPGVEYRCALQAGQCHFCEASRGREKPPRPDKSHHRPPVRRRHAPLAYGSPARRWALFGLTVVSDPARTHGPETWDCQWRVEPCRNSKSGGRGIASARQCIDPEGDVTVRRCRWRWMGAREAGVDLASMRGLVDEPCDGCQKDRSPETSRARPRSGRADQGPVSPIPRGSATSGVTCSSRFKGGARSAGCRSTGSVASSTPSGPGLKPEALAT